MLNLNIYFLNVKSHIQQIDKISQARLSGFIKSIITCVVNVSINDDVTNAIVKTMFLEYIHLYLCLSGC